MSRIEERFIKLRERNEKALITYIMAGDPSLTETEGLIRGLEEAGSDIIELGVPFSDPLADGPTIQKASARALRKGISLTDVINLVARVREGISIPLILMSYYNPIFKYGEERFVKDAVAAGVDGVIVPDLPPDEASTLIMHSRKAGLDTVFLLSPTSDNERISLVCKASTGFIYYVSLTGVTGARESMSSDIGKMTAKIRKGTKTPVAVGFGISGPEQARQISSYADGVIVGSAIVSIIEENAGSPQLLNRVREFALQLKKGMTAG